MSYPAPDYAKKKAPKGAIPLTSEQILASVQASLVVGLYEPVAASAEILFAEGGDVLMAPSFSVPLDFA